MKAEIESLKKWLEGEKGWQFVREMPAKYYGFYQAQFMTPAGEIKVAQAHKDGGRIEMIILRPNNACGYADGVDYIQRNNSELMQITTTSKRKFKRGTILWNAQTDRAERIVTITPDTIGTRKSGKNSPIEIHDREAFISPTKGDIQTFLGHKGRFKKTAFIITDAGQSAIALGDKVVIVANTDPRMPKIKAAIEAGNNRSLAQLISQRRTNAEIVKRVRKQLEVA